MNYTAKTVLDSLDTESPFEALYLPEVTALISYTEWGFQAYNAALRGSDVQVLDSQENDIKMIVSGLNRLPRFKGTVVRCELRKDLDLEGFDKQKFNRVIGRYKENETQLMKGFLSTSLGTDPRFIEGWMDPCLVVMHINLKSSAAYIAPLSGRDYEEEVLVQPMTYLRTISKEISTKNGMPFVEIHLEEVE